MNTITSSNAVFMLTIVGLYDSPVQIQGFAADAAFAGDQLKPTEVVQGVDGNMSVGFTPSLYKQKISLMPDSPSHVIFEDWQNAQTASQEVYIANATITIPGIGRSYELTRGALTGAKAMPDAKKVLAASDFEITWNTVVGSNA